MIPFPGESLGVFAAAAITGTDADMTLANDVTIRDGSRFVASGIDEVRAWIEPGSATYLEGSTEPVVISWVVEFSGTLHVAAAEGFDPDYSDDPFAPAPVDLGEHTFTSGPAVIASTFTADDVLNSADALMLSLTVLTGTSADVQQVKLRVWPPGGAAGAWSDTQPGFDTNPVPVTPYWGGDGDALDGGLVTESDAATAWNLGVSAFRAKVSAAAGPVTRTFSPYADGAAQASIHFTREDVDLLGMRVRVGPAFALLRGLRPEGRYPISDALVDGVDYIRPPSEVEGDYAAYAQQVGTGSTGWTGARVVCDYPATDLPGLPTLWAGSGDLPVTLNPDLSLSLSFGIVSGSPMVSGGWDLPTSGPDILLIGSHQITTLPLPWPGVEPSVLDPYIQVGNMWFGFPGEVASFARMPEYRVWNPTATAESPLRLMRRGDDLGMGSSRIYSTGTRQRSTRVFGVL